MGKPSKEEVTKWARDFLVVASAAPTGGIAAEPLSDTARRVGAPAKAGPRVAEADKTANKKARGPAAAKTKGKPGEHGNIEYFGKYQISIPPDSAGKKLPLLVLFAGNTYVSAMKPQTPPSYYQKAILVFSENNGSFSDLQGELKKALAENGTSYDKVSICGYSSGGQTALWNYTHANHRVGLIDPTIYASDLWRLDKKAIVSINPGPGNWKNVINSKGENAFDGRNAALKSKKAGEVESKSTPHGTYPGVFLSDHESKLI
jgi:hypothetical protein